MVFDTKPRSTRKSVSSSATKSDTKKNTKDDAKDDAKPVTVNKTQSTKEVKDAAKKAESLQIDTTGLSFYNEKNRKLIDVYYDDNRWYYSIHSKRTDTVVDRGGPFDDRDDAFKVAKQQVGA